MKDSTVRAQGGVAASGGVFVRASGRPALVPPKYVQIDALFGEPGKHVTDFDLIESKFRHLTGAFSTGCCNRSLMARHPEQFDRGSEGQPYGPDEPPLVRWADVVAARNTAQALFVVLKATEVDLDATRLAVGRQVREWLPTAVSETTDEAIGSREEAIACLRIWCNASGVACRRPLLPHQGGEQLSPWLG